MFGVDNLVDPCYTVNTWNERRNKMPILDNPYDYDSKVPTNIRLDREIKEIILKEAEEKGTNMADIINNILVEHYKDK